MEVSPTYQFTYGAAPSQPAAPLVDINAPTFASEDGLVASLSSQECIFQIKRSGETHVMTFQVLQAMDQCREFRSLDEHIARIQSAIPALAGKRDDVRRVLDGLIQRKLLTSDQDFIDRLRAAPARETSPLRAVFIRACDRPEQLKQLLVSLTDYERAHRGGRRYVMLDDSVLSANINEQRDSLREFARATGCKVHYIGRAESARIAEKLGKAVPQSKDVAQKLLLRDAHTQAQRFGGGRGWNLALLLSSGARMALLDDDLRLKLKRPPFASAGLDPNPNLTIQARFMANMEEAFDFGEDTSVDPFELHLSSCGQTLGNLASTGYPVARASLRGMNLSRLDLLAGDSRVMATQLATYGSARTEIAVWLYQLGAESREDFWRERAAYRHNIEAQHVWFGVGQARVSEITGFTPFTLDNSVMLPCTNPIGRGEDSVFSAMARYCHPDALVLELPEGIAHVQETPRKRSEATFAAFTPRVNHFLRDYVQRNFGLFKAKDPAYRLRFLAEIYRDLAYASPTDCVAHLREYLDFTRADLVDRLQHELEAATDAPVYWQADARMIVEASAKAMLNKNAPRLGDWPDDIDEAGCADALGNELKNMAEACEHWPALWQHAQEQGENLLTSL